jgi:hypothetical protein
MAISTKRYNRVGFLAGSTHGARLSARKWAYAGDRTWIVRSATMLLVSAE